jgi:plasmid maintenance system killer protein
MQIRFGNDQLADWYANDYNGKQPFSEIILKAYRKAVDKMMLAPTMMDMAQNKSLGLHPLRHDLVGRFAVRVNMQYRIVFVLVQETDLLEVIEIEDLTDYH